MKARIIREPRCALLWRIDESYPNYAAITRAARRYDVKLRPVADGDLGGIVGDLGENSAVRGSKDYGVVYTKIYGSTAKPEYKVLTSGGIAGVSAKGTVIENCGFGGQLKGADDAHTFEMKLGNICSDTNFAGSGNTLWDGK